jgi:ABC-type polysaccharide/polyol phosphate export permease
MRSLKSRYRGSFLGVFWSFGNPILMTALYATVFGTAFASYYHGSVLRYVLSCFTAIVVMLFFVQSTSQALSQVVANGSLLNKIRVSPAIFPLGAIAANFLQASMTTFPILIIMSVIVTHDPLRVVLVPVAVFALLMLTVGVALAMSALFAFFRDLPYLWEIVASMLWITTPIFYPAALVPAKIRPLLEWNPLASTIESFRSLVLERGDIEYRALVEALGAGVVACALGCIVFIMTRDDFMDLL